MKKLWYKRDYRLEHEGGVWYIDMAKWVRSNGTGEIRVHRIHGDINNPALIDGLQLMANAEGIPLSIAA